jgi:hypothetical protein
MRKEVDAEGHIRRLAADVMLALVEYNPRNLGGEDRSPAMPEHPATLPYLRMTTCACSLP